MVEKKQQQQQSWKKGWLVVELSCDANPMHSIVVEAGCSAAELEKGKKKK